MKNLKSLIMYILTIIFFLLTILFLIFAFYQREAISNKYNEACKLIEEENYKEAIEILESLQDYKDGYELLIESKANELLQAEKYEEAIEMFQKIEYYNDITNKINNTKYNLAIQYFKTEDYDNSKLLFEELGSYKESKKYLDKIEIKKLTQLKEDIYKKACDLLNKKKYKEALEKFNSILDYSDSQEQADKCKKFLHTTISAGIHYSAAVTSEGKGICTNKIYELYDWNNLVSISCLGTMIIGLNENGTVQYEGHKNGENSHDVYIANVSEWKDIVQISAGQQHLVGLTYDGKVLTSGYEGNNLKDVFNWTDICFITTGWMNTVGLDTNGNIHIAGYKSQELLNDIKATKDWNDIVLISAGGGDSERHKKGHIVGLRKDGTVVAVGDNDYSQCEVGNWDNIIAISAGDYHTVGLKKDGTVVTTRPSEEQMKKLSSDSPFRVDDWKEIIAISAGRGFTLGLQSDGSVISTGNTDNFKKPKEDDPAWEKIKMYDVWNNMTKR